MLSQTIAQDIVDATALRPYTERIGGCKERRMRRGTLIIMFWMLTWVSVETMILIFQIDWLPSCFLSVYCVSAHVLACPLQVFRHLSGTRSKHLLPTQCLGAWVPAFRPDDSRSDSSLHLLNKPVLLPLLLLAPPPPHTFVLSGQSFSGKRVLIRWKCVTAAGVAQNKKKWETNSPLMAGNFLKLAKKDMLKPKQKKRECWQ